MKFRVQSIWSWFKSCMKLYYIYYGDLSNIFITAAEYWFEEGRLELEKALKLENFNKNKAKNVVLFLGDGMSLPTVTAARIFKGQIAGASGEEDYLSWETFPHFGLAKVGMKSTIQTCTIPFITSFPLDYFVYTLHTKIIGVLIQ